MQDIPKGEIGLNSSPGNLATEYKRTLLSDSPVNSIPSDVSCCVLLPLPSITLPGVILISSRNSEIAAPKLLKIKPGEELNFNQDGSQGIDSTLVPQSEPDGETNSNQDGSQGIWLVSNNPFPDQQPTPHLENNQSQENQPTPNDPPGVQQPSNNPENSPSQQSNPPIQNQPEEVAPTPGENPKENYLAKKTEITPSESEVNIEEPNNEGSKTLVVSTTTNNADKKQIESALGGFSTSPSGLQSLVTAFVSFLKQISFFFLV